MKNRNQSFDVVLILFAFLIIFISALSFRRINAMISASEWVSKSDLIKLKLEQTLSFVKDAETGQRGFVLTSDSSFLDVYYGAFPKVNRLMEELDSMTKDNASERTKLAELKVLIQLKNIHVKRLIENSNAPNVSKDLFVKGKFLMSEIRNRTLEIMLEEDKILKQRVLVRDEYRAITPSFSLSLIIITLLIIIISLIRIKNDKLKVKKQNDELLRVQTYLQSILDSSSDAIITVDENLNYTSLNRAAEKMLRKKREELIGKNPFELFPHAAGTERHKMMLKALGGETQQMDGVGSILNPDIKIQTLFVPLIIEGRIKGVLNIAKDITSLVRANETILATNSLLERKNDELEDANKELLSFNYVASHDLKEPLRKIQTFGKLITEQEDQNLSVNAKNYFARMIAASARMQTMIEALLDFSKVQVNDVVYSASNLHTLVEEIVEERKEDIAERNGKIFFSDLPVINAIPALMYQLLSNLIGNSIKYAKKDVALAINIRVGLAEDIVVNARSQKGLFWKITVSDNGIGFDPQFATKVFDLFQRLHGNSNVYEGTGIGLTICKKIVQNHKGHILADSQQNEGATFTVFIPQNL